ncbi:MAG: radical SAM protein [Candidatus Methanofastidiosia archaeon]
MHFAIIDCYTDEPSGLGVMPYVGTYPRYLAGAILETKNKFYYLTIDDIRATVRTPKPIEDEMKTNIKTRNLTPNFSNAKKILNSSDVIVVIAGVHTPGKYLSAYPGTTKEVIALLEQLKINAFIILSGPAAYIGSGLWGGKKARNAIEDREIFDLVIGNIEYNIKELIDNNFTYDPHKACNYEELQKKALLGVHIVPQLPHRSEFLIAEIETMRGCAKEISCSFCTEHLKSETVSRRNLRDIVAEIKALSQAGMRNVRIGKQTCIYSYGSDEDIEKLFREARKYTDILHIDNVNPLFVNEEKTKSIVRYCTPGNIASLGVESFDPIVAKKNHLNTSPELIYDTIKLINKYGAERGKNGLPKFLPGINLVFGLMGESKKTHEENIFWLRKILDEGLLLRRINIREVVVFLGTVLHKEAGNKFLKKNRKYYWKWRNDIRNKIDNPMLEKIVPTGTIITNLRTEIYDGKTTFARQIGTYPLIVGIKGRIGLDRWVNVKVEKHMLRSITGEVV